jgi:uncharacterized protein involved in type VI secretion and phage assembly
VSACGGKPGLDGEHASKFYGKYRGRVTDIKDPLSIGRIRAKVPDVMGDQDSGWAMPSMPSGGSGMGLFALPSVGAGVWIEFEQGDPDDPIWSGCFFGSPAEVPPVLLPPLYNKVLLKTKGGNSIVLDDTPGTGGITLETSSGQKIASGSSKEGPYIEITNGLSSIKVTSKEVAINGQALVVSSL